MPPRIVFLDRDSVRARFRPLTGEHEWIEYPETPPEALEARLQGATVAVVNKVRLDAGLLQRLPDLGLVAVAATGADNVDLEACRRQGIVVSNVRGYAAHTVPEHVLALILALRRRLFEYAADIRAGRWQQASTFCFFDHPIGDLHGSTLAIIGSGSLGQGVARLAEAFGMRVIFAERRGISTPRPGRVAFVTALAEADVLSLHCPLTPETHHLIGAPELAAMRPGALLINTARGGLVDGAALAAALRSGRLGGAGIDVLPMEPPSQGDPLLAPDIPKLIVTPHVAWASVEAMQALAEQVVDNIQAFLDGAPRNRLA